MLVKCATCQAGITIMTIHRQFSERAQSTSIPLSIALLPLHTEKTISTRKRSAIKPRPIISREQEFCAGNPNWQSGDDSSGRCPGDAGSGLICDNGYGRPVVSGVMSWGEQCDSAGNPSVFSKVFYSILLLIFHP